MYMRDSFPEGMEVRRDTKLAAVFPRFRAVRLLGKADETGRKYEIELRRLDAFLGRPATLGDLTDDTVSQLLATMRAKSRSINTANKTRACLLAIWRWCASHRYVSEWPDVAKLREPERVPIAWSQDEVRQLFSALRKLPGKIGRARSADWWIALHLVIWDTAERVGAIMKLEWKAVDLTTGWIVIPAELRKGKTRDKAHRLHRETVEALKKLRGVTAPRIFEWPYRWETLWGHYAKVLRTANLPTDRRSKFHRLRRTVATLYELQGGNATELLDHSKRSVTTQSYLDPRFLKTKQACDLLPRPGKRRRA